MALSIFIDGGNLDHNWQPKEGDWIMFRDLVKIENGLDAPLVDVFRFSLTQCLIFHVQNLKCGPKRSSWGCAGCCSFLLNS